MSTNFAAIVSDARRHVRWGAGMTAAEFDFSLTSKDGVAMAALGDMIYVHANRHLPAVQTDADLSQRRANAAVLNQALRPQIDAMVAAAKTKAYTGWSDASGGPVRYGR